MDAPTPIANLTFAALLPRGPICGSDAHQLAARLNAQIAAVAAIAPPSGEVFVVRGFKLGGDAEGTMYVAQIIYGIQLTPVPGVQAAVEIPVGQAFVDFEKCAQSDAALQAGWAALLARVPALSTVYEVQDDIGGAGGAPMIGILYQQAPQ